MLPFKRTKVRFSDVSLYLVTHWALLMNTEIKTLKESIFLSKFQLIEFFLFCPFLFMFGVITPIRPSRER